MTFRIQATMLVLSGLLLAGCNTTKETTASMQREWVGRPADQFFAMYGPPKTAFDLGSGGKVYTWRGGEQRVRLPQNRSASSPSTISRGFSKSSSSTQLTGPGQSVTRSTSTSASVNLDVDKLMAIATGQQQEAPTRLAYCEMQIATGKDGVITQINTTTDTAGTGFSFSRCSEIFGG